MRCSKWRQMTNKLVIYPRRKVVRVQSCQHYQYRSLKSFLRDGKGLPSKLMGDPRADEPRVKLMDRATIRLQRRVIRGNGRTEYKFSPRWRMSRSFHFVIHSSGSFFLSPHVSNPMSLGCLAYRYPYPCEQKLIRKIRYFLRKTIDNAFAKMMKS